ncbi:CaiB/BaiF CoA transferase family protein [Xanthobacter dioxanivorans]|uniref:CaiB/BaiF CoA transferase family protein n=1 Tax=Xanthobacter dioxanivorans TaxID=2528964 RepID=UPI001E38D8F4|nr:CoA transferase [Xanthobacter dioxanivorans]
MDFTRMFAGPFCTMLLGDLGADVVKIEAPEGDPIRAQGPPFFEGESMSYLAVNRNKRSIVLDMKREDDKATARALALKADVIVENFRPDVMGRLGVGYESVCAENPGVIYAAMSGMGATGPLRDKGAFDLTIQAEGGYMSLTGEAEGTPIKLGTSAFDLICGQYAMGAITTALYARERTGRGQKIETSLLEGMVSFLVDAGVEYLTMGTLRPKWGSEHPNNVPYKAFAAADGWIVVGAGAQHLYEGFVRVLKREDLAVDPRFRTLRDRVTNRAALYRILDEVVAQWKVEELVAALDAAGVPCAPVNDVAAVFRHPQVIERGMLQTVPRADGSQVPTIGPAAKFSSVDITRDWKAPPRLGEHGAEVLRDWLAR